MVILEQNSDGARRLKGLIMTYETLTKEIAERSRRVWQLGSIFVPVTFLILTQGIIARASLGELGYGIIVASACLLFLTYAFSLKHTNNVNDLQLSRLREVEKEIGQAYGFEAKELFGVYEWSHSRVRGSFVRAATRFMEYFVGIPALVLAILYYLNNPFLSCLAVFALVFGLVVVTAALVSSFGAIATYVFLASSRFWSRRLACLGLCPGRTARRRPSFAAIQSDGD